MSAPSADLAPYERRAAEAEARLDALETAMAGGGAVGDAFRVELIVALRDVRQQLGSARCAQQRLEAAKETAEASAASLRAENEKLRYRVTHLVRSLKEADAARPPPPPPPLQRFSTTPFAYKSPLAAATAPPPATP